MKIKCKNIVTCGNYNCAWNYECRCGHDVVSLDANGKCALEKPIAKPAETKANKPFDVETSK